MSSKEYKCNICNKMYSSYKSLWYHNYKYHKNTSTNDVTPCNTNVTNCNNNVTNCNNNVTNCNNDNIIKYYCPNCNNNFNNRQTRWRHIKICNNNNINTCITTNNIINNKNNTTSINNNININTNTINNKINNKIIINKIGNENVLDLTITEVMDIFNKELSCITLLIEYLHFNERLPENHSFCTTNLESKYVSIYNVDKQLIKKDRKKYLFDTILDNSTHKLENLFNHYKNKFSHARQYEIKDTIYNIKKLKDAFYNDKIRTEICNKINLISYNNKNLVQNTWNNTNKIIPKRKITFQEDLELPPSDSDNHITESESELESDTYTEPNKILSVKLVSKK